MVAPFIVSNFIDGHTHTLSVFSPLTITWLSQFFPLCFLLLTAAGFRVLPPNATADVWLISFGG